MKKTFKILFGLLIALTLFLSVDVNAEIKIDEEKKTIPTKGNYVANYEIKDNILTINFPKPEEKEIENANLIVTLFTEGYYAITDIIHVGDIRTYTLESELVEYKEENVKYDSITKAVPKTLRIKLTVGIPSDVMWDEIKNIYEGNFIGGAGDTSESLPITFDKNSKTIKMGDEEYKYTIEDGIFKLIPQKENDRIDSWLMNKLIIAYMNNANPGYKILPLTEISNIGSYGVLPVKKDSSDNMYNSLSLNLKISNNDPEKLMNKIIDEVTAKNTSDDPSNSKTEENKNNNNNNTKPSGTKVSVKDTATTYSKVAMILGSICMLIGVAIATITVAKANSPKEEI